MNDLILPAERIVSKIILLIDEKVMLDIHLAELYGIETRVLKQAVRRNNERFPADFMFELTETEINLMVSHSVIPSRSHLGGAKPFAFTESGVDMLSSVLKSKLAVEINISIIRTFVSLRKLQSDFQELFDWKDKVENKLSEHAGQIIRVFELIEQLDSMSIRENEQKNRPRIGFKTIAE